jgi:SAM-dependent methyltransferase
MKLTYENIQKTLDVKPSESRIKELLGLINTGFTSDRDKINEYIESPEMVAAYTLFYLPTNIPKLKFILNQLPQSVLDDLASYRFIDIGTGPGTFSLAWLDFFAGNRTAEVIGVDKSKLMLGQAKRSKEFFFPNEAHVSFQKEIPVKKDKTVLFWGHSLNEMGLDKAVKLIDQMEPDYLFLIEPGTPELFLEVSKLRKLMSTRKYQAVYPCSTLSSECPIYKRVKKGEEDWCHQVLRTTHEPSIERLSQIINRNRRVMPLIAHVYRKEELLDVKQKARVIRFFRESKFSFEWEICLFDNERNKLRAVKVEVMKKTLSKSRIKELKNESVGVEIEFEIKKKIKDGHWRIELIE